VWRGNTATEALSVANRHLLDLSAAERDFLAAVRKQLTRGRRRKLFAVTTIFIVLGLVIAGGTISVIRISAAEKVAKQKAIDADAETQRARTAEAKVKAQLAAVQTAEQKQSAAELDAEQKRRLATEAQQGLALSKEELQKKNAELLQTAAEAKAAQARAEKLAKEAAAAAETARKATEIATKARDEAARLLDREKARNKDLQQQMQAISTGGLK